MFRGEQIIVAVCLWCDVFPAVEQEVLEMLRTSGANPASSQPMPLGPPLQQLPAPDFRETSASLDF